MADNDHDHNEHEVSEPSEATLIVESDVLNKVRQEASERNEAFLIAIAGPQTGKMYKLDRNETVIGRSPKSDLQIQDVGVSRSHAKFYHSLHGVYVEDLGSANGTFVNGDAISVPTPLRDGDKITLGSTTILKFTYHDKLDEDFQKKMFDAALRDGLTQAYNKKYFQNQLYTEYSFAKRHQQPVGLVLFDVDHFKAVNDTFGHLAGDAVLAKLASVGMRTVRVEDTFARYGGEEFAILLRANNQADSTTLADRLREDVEGTNFVHNGRRIPITISVGVASFPEIWVDSAEQLVAAADGALYRAKANGRNRVEVAV